VSDNRSALHNGSALHDSSPRHDRSAAHNRSALLSQRAAVILLLGALTAIGAGVLTCFNGGTLASAALVGGAAFGAGVTFFHTVID
jgi:hypothetical protein